MSFSRKAIVIHSPHSGRSAELAHALTYLRHAQIEIVEVLAISELDNLSVQGTIWRENGIDLAIAAGGDGLVGGVVTHIAESRLPLGILPLGTANDIARSLHIPQNIQRATDVIHQGQIRLIDIGIARPAEQTPHNAGGQQGVATPSATQVAPQKHGFFAHALTIGLNVEFARLATNIATRQRYGRMTYPFAALEVLRNHAALAVTLHLEELLLHPTHQTPSMSNVVLATPTYAEGPIQLQCNALQVAVINAPIFGGQWQLTIPGASVSDGLLDIVVLEEVEVGKLGATFARLFNHEERQAPTLSEWHTRYPALHPAELTGIPGIHHVQAKRVIIMTNVDPQDVTLDGEVRGQTPMLVQTAVQRLRVLVPTTTSHA